jgi:hypothetical protein
LINERQNGLNEKRVSLKPEELNNSSSRETLTTLSSEYHFSKEKHLEKNT